MVKSKRNVNEFQKAMLSNTKIIGNAEEGSDSSPADNDYLILDPQLMAAYEKLADKVNVNKTALIEIALQHFLNLEDVWFKK
jgi:hypothetical protein